MSITSRITSMEEHIEQAYDELQGLGADLTNVNKNIENISMVLDDIYDSLPSVSGEGTSLTLDDTRVGKIKSTLKGNTSQTTYSGKNLIPNNGNTETKNGITFTKNEDNTITLNGTATADTYKNVWYSETNNLINDTSQVYTMSIGVSNTNLGVGIYERINNNWSTIKYVYAETSTYTPSGNQTGQLFRVIVKNGAVLNNVIVKPMLVKGTTVGEYEPYVGGTASPNPSYPQPINVVSGDNEINVCGKNLHDFSYWIQNINQGTNITYSNRTDSSVNITASARGYTAFGYNQQGGTSLYRAKVEPNTEYTFSYNGEFISGTQGIGTFVFMANTINGDYTTLKVKDVSTSVTFTTTSTTNYIWFRIDLYNACTYRISNIQLEKGSSATTYEPYQGNTYNIDLGVENLFDKNGNLSLNYRLTTSGENYAETGSYISEYIPINSNTTYTKNSPTADAYHRVCFYSNNDTTSFISKSEDNTFTTPSNAKYLRFCGLQTEIDTTQLEVGSKANSYTPYGTTPIELCKIGNYQDYFYKDSGKWYKYGMVGKVVLDGTQTITINSSSASRTVFEVNNITNLKDYATLEEQDDLPNILCSKFNQVSQNASWVSGNISKKRLNQNKVFIIWEANKTIAELEMLTTNMPIYYVLETPTNTEITYQPLIDQLNLLEKAMSKDGQTNISQVNNDLPFIISASALKEWSV